MNKRQLKILFQEYNTKYFGGKLPKTNIVFNRGNTHFATASGWEHKNKIKSTIYFFPRIINRYISIVSPIYCITWESILLHEMIHIEQQTRPDQFTLDHGFWFRHRLLEIQQKSKIPQFFYYVE